jgi:DNA-directed RNA polymerase specialized sigma subunit
MTRERDDIAKWKQWQKDPNSSNLSTLVKQMQPVIYKATQINQGALSPAVIEAEAKIQAVNAFKTYDPKKDVKLSTHLTNYLQKVNRINYKYQDLYKVPEDRRIKYNTFNTAKSDFEDSYGREPSIEELSSRLGWSQREVSRYLRENRQELSQSVPYPSDLGAHDTTDETIVSYVYNDLSPKDKLVFEYTTGYQGRRKLTNSEIMAKLGLTQGQLSYAKSKISKRIKEARGYGFS